MAPDVIDAGTTDAPSTIGHMKRTGVDHVNECGGTPKVIEDRISAMGREGSVVSLGVPPTGSKVSLDLLDFLLEKKSI